MSMSPPRIKTAPLIAAVAGVTGVSAVAWAIRDYRAWRALGPGGLPHTLRGWLQMTRWRAMMDDPLASAPLRALIGTDQDTRTLDGLADRDGPRPRIAPQPVPHRQLDQHAPEWIRPAQQALFDTKVAAEATTLHYAQSHFEKHNQAITLRQVPADHCDACASCGEIAHIHPSDGSMHMILGPSDALRVLEGGWGERHGLAGKALNLPATYTLVYAPRTKAELAVIGRILSAAVAHMRKTPTTPG